MNYSLAYKYAFQHPKWMTNILLATLCILIPAVGPIVVLGWISEVTDALNADPERKRYPEFQFDRFMEYLQRGVWPFVIALIVGLPLGMMAGVAYVLMFVFIANDLAVVGFALFMAAMAMVVLLQVALVGPMAFHAEVTRRFDFGGAFRFVRSFWGLVGGRAAVALVVTQMLAIPISLAGALLCCVGIYPAQTVIFMAHQHIMVQLYQAYLEQGGEPLVYVPPPPPPGYAPYPPPGYYPPQQPPQQW